MKVMFDTNVFSNIANGNISGELIPQEWQPVATHIQWDEIQQTQNEVRRAEIVGVFVEYLVEKLPTSTAVWGVSKWGEAEWTGPSSHYQTILDQLNIGCANKQNKTRYLTNNPKDALIADTCAQRGLTLVTNDRALLDVARTHGIPTVNLQHTQ